VSIEIDDGLIGQQADGKRFHSLDNVRSCLPQTAEQVQWAPVGDQVLIYVIRGEITIGSATVTVYEVKTVEMAHRGHQIPSDIDADDGKARALHLLSSRQR
jgi:hypothetical protein